MTAHDLISTLLEVKAIIWDFHRCFVNKQGNRCLLSHQTWKMAEAKKLKQGFSLTTAAEKKQVGKLVSGFLVHVITPKRHYDGHYEKFSESWNIPLSDILVISRGSKITMAQSLGCKTHELSKRWNCFKVQPGVDCTPYIPPVPYRVADDHGELTHCRSCKGSLAYLYRMSGRSFVPGYCWDCS